MRYISILQGTKLYNYIVYFVVKEDVWIGLNFSKDPTQFNWTNKEQVLFTNWAQGEPDITNEKKCVRVLYSEDAEKVRGYMILFQRIMIKMFLGREMDKQ